MVAAAGLPAYLASLGARPGAAGVADFGEPAREWEAARAGAIVADAADLGVIRIEGPDAAKFLQGQLSNDVEALEHGRGQWTTYNSPKGRMLATMFLVREPLGDSYLAVLARELIEPIRKRLAMFVLRAKVALDDAPDLCAVIGVGGPAATTAVREAFGVVPEPGRAASVDAGRIVHLPDGRIVVATSPGAATAAFEAIARHATPAGGPVWSWLGVMAGVPLVTAATQDQFVAQTANQDALGALNFRKGCYTGQEIIARTQHLGRLKERLYAFRTRTDPPPPGTRLYSAAFGTQASGTVVNSAPDPDGGSRLLAVAQIEAARDNAMAIGAPDGPAAERVPLPYDVPPPTVPRGRVGA